MAFSFKNLRITRDNAKDVIYKIVRRTIILFALGLFINQSVDIVNIRIPGVLQRFAISYFVVSMVILFVPKLELKVKRRMSTRDCYLLNRIAIRSIQGDMNDEEGGKRQQYERLIVTGSDPNMGAKVSVFGLPSHLVSTDGLQISFLISINGWPFLASCSCT